MPPLPPALGHVTCDEVLKVLQAAGLPVQEEDARRMLKVLLAGMLHQGGGGDALRMLKVLLAGMLHRGGGGMRGACSRCCRHACYMGGGGRLFGGPLGGGWCVLGLGWRRAG